MSTKETALIVGAGSGLSGSLARLFAREGMHVALAARDTAKLDGLVRNTGACDYPCDASRPDEVDKLFASVSNDLGEPDIVVYNASYRARGSIIDLAPAEVENALMVTCYGGFLVGQAATRRMIHRGSGTILFTGASASVKGYAESAPFAMGKFGLRGLAQSMARELAPRNIHVAHFIIDGRIQRPAAALTREEAANDMLHPDAIAETYLQIHRQHRSAWTWEVELRPWVEPF